MSDQQTDVNAPVEPQEPTTPDSSPEENKAPEAADPVLEALSDGDDTPAEAKGKDTKAETDKPKGEPAEQDKKPEEVENPKAEETDAEGRPRGEDGKFLPKNAAPNRKEELNNDIRNLVAQRNALKQEVEQLNSQVYQPQSEDELQQQGYSPEMAAIEQMRQEREIERYNNQVAESQLSIDTESARVLQDFPVFNPDSDQFKPELAREASQLLEANLVYDQNTGQVIGSNVSPYQLYKTLAGAYSASQTEGQLKGQKATEQMLANADVSSNAAPPKPKFDPIMAGLESDD